MSRAVVIGRSHTNAIAQALSRWESNPPAIEVHLLESPNHVARTPTISIEQAKEIASSLPADVPLFLAMLGTYHNVLGLLRTAPEYDFLIDPTDAPATNCVTRIPHRAMAMAFEQHLARAETVRDLRSAAASPAFLLSTPPPKQSNEFLLEKFMRQKRQEYRGRSVAEIGIEEANTRLKLWKLETGVTAAWAGSEGLGYVSVPPGATHSSGFLDRKFYNDDATHANPDYGALVVEQILEITETLKVEHASISAPLPVQP